MAILLAFLLLCIASVSAAPSAILSQRQTACAGIPNDYSPPSVAKLPNPFVSADGNAITTQAQWACRQQELSQLIQQYELGTKPSRPSTLSASFASNALTINAGNNGKSISFTAQITYPHSGSGPFPAIIALGGASIPIPANVATIVLNNDDIAAQNDQSSRGQGKFYTLYGANAIAGAMSAWAWAVSRIIDALEMTPAANIDLAHLGVTGCSRNGKGALVAGALDPRIALTIPQESGSGGAACWRVSDALFAAGNNIQTAHEIVGENVWFSTLFNPFVNDTSRLPHDHHELAALVAPRGLYVIENDIDWLGPGSTTVCMEVGRIIYRAVGAPDAMGFSQSPNHAHCAFPSYQQAELSAFIDRYLLGGSSSTANVQDTTQNVSLASWIDWTPPVLV